MKQVGHKLRQNEHGNYISMEIKIHWLYILRLKIIAFYHALKRIKIHLKLNKKT